MGSVYEAIDRELDARVALKRLDRFGPEQLARFKREFRDFQNLSHPNLVALRELFSDGAEWFFSMELLDGVDFLEYVRPSVVEDIAGSLRNATTETVTNTAAAAITTRTHPPLPKPRTPPTRLVRGPLDEQRLRHALPQLAAAIQALHDAGKLHCDIKPSNVLVTRDGRVVVLDYGVAVDVDVDAAPCADMLIGTVAYMSPEQAACQKPGPAADWYAVGVVLFEALTGRRPHQGSTLEILAAKQTGDGPAPRDEEPAAPADLSELCEVLLKVAPSARPTGADVLARVGGVRSRPRRTRVTKFVGRTAQLSVLDAAYRESRSRGWLVVVHGESGIGKSALVRHFVDEVKRVDPRVIALMGTCYERESVPYKAFDGIIDALGSHLSALPLVELATLLPEHMSLVADAFPALRIGHARGSSVAACVPRSAEPRELRSRLFGAIRDLFRRISEAAPLVVVIDDVQWADVDSRALLGELMAEPDAPRLLLVAIVRSDGTREAALERLGLADLVRDTVFVPVERMLPDEAHALALQLAHESGRARDVDASVIARIAEGHPLFLDALVRDTAWLCSAPLLPASLQEMLWARITRLSPSGRHVLELVAIASGKIVLESLAAAVGLALPELVEVVTELHRFDFVLATGSAARDRVSPYHDQIRSAVLEHLAPETQRSHHRHLAEALEATRHIDPEALTVHWRECGERAKAAHFAQVAGDKAARALAFDRAASFYKQCLTLLDDERHDRIARDTSADADQVAPRQNLTAAQHVQLEALDVLRSHAAYDCRDTGSFDTVHGLQRASRYGVALGDPSAGVIRVKLAGALSHAGRSREAGVAYLRAAALAVGIQKLELCRQAAEQLLRSGHVDEGISVLREVLATVKLKLAPTPTRALSSLLCRRAKIAYRGLEFRERDESRVAVERLTRIDTCWAAAACLSMVDTIRGADFQAQHLLLSLEAGEPYRIARALALEGGYQSLTGGAGSARADAILKRATELAGRIGNAHAIGLVGLMSGIAAFQAGKWSIACDRLAAAEATLREHCTGVAWELTSAHMFQLNATYYVGRLAELQRRVPLLVKEAIDRGDRYATTDLRLSNLNLIWLAQDDERGARVAAREAIAQCSPRGYLDQHFYALMALTNIDLYAGDGVTAYRRVMEQWPAIKKAMLLRIQSIRIVALQMRAYAAIAAAASADSKLFDIARRDAVALAKERMVWASGFAAAIRAAIAGARGDAEEAERLLASAQNHFAAAEMPLFAAASLRQRGLLIGGERGRQLSCSAEDAMNAQNIVRLDRYAAVLLPGFVR